MIKITVKWVCSNCGSNNLANKKGLLKCSVCGKVRDSEELTESAAENVPLPIDYWEPPYSEDRIKWNLEILRRMYSSIFRSDTPGKYILYDKNENFRFINKSQLLMTKLASMNKETSPKKILIPDELIKESCPNRLWTADGRKYRINYEKMEELKLSFLGAVNISGINGYLLRKNESDDYHFYTNWMCIKMGLLVNL